MNIQKFKEVVLKLFSLRGWEFNLEDIKVISLRSMPNMFAEEMISITLVLNDKNTEISLSENFTKIKINDVLSEKDE